MGRTELYELHVPGKAVDGWSEGSAWLSHQLHAPVHMYVCQ